MISGLYSVLPENVCLRCEFKQCLSNASVNVDRGIWCHFAHTCLRRL